MKNKSKKYFVLANQYLESSKLLLKTIIDNENINIGIGFSTDDALKNFSENLLRSDAYLLIPALFVGYQSVELYIKGLLLLKNIPIDKNHEVSAYYKSLKDSYGEQSNIYKSIYNFYSYQIEIIKEFKMLNNITSIKQLYEALRYPENEDIQYDHSNLKYNGSKVIDQIEKVVRQMDLIRKNVNIEFSKEFIEKDNIT